ncbi:hypothetical protein KY330_01400 [Candidatus Woesearchaeota archaeon]|nr:hypothetical protein [Candidatus Woesearchaeota archaeon]
MISLIILAVAAIIWNVSVWYSLKSHVGKNHPETKHLFETGDIFADRFQRKSNKYALLFHNFHPEDSRYTSLLGQLRMSTIATIVLLLAFSFQYIINY